MKKIVITGAMGYIGTELCKIYSGLTNQYEVIALDRDFYSDRVNRLNTWGIKFIQCDILDIGKLSNVLKDADIVYVKNWSSFEDYGKVLHQNSNWMMTKEKLGHAIFMHCLPVRRNVVVEDAVLDSEQSVVIAQAGNRMYAAQAVLKLLLECIH